MMDVPHGPKYTPLKGAYMSFYPFFDLQPKSPTTITPAASSPTSKINFSFKYDTIVQHDFAKTRYADAARFASLITD